jgi:WD40 repeat protein
MNERSIFLEALDQADPTQRSAYLDKACAGDAALRQRVEALLKTHSEAGGFLDKLAPERVAEELGRQQVGEETQGASPGNDKADEDLGFLTPSDKPDSIGRLGHYKVQEVIGRGGMGVVLRAFDEELHRVVAIKVMAQQLATNATARKRFKREAQAVAAVIHDHIVTIHAVEEANGLPYLVMQYVAGLSLHQRLDRDGPLELEEILRIGMQTASGLAAAHAMGLVHRDIKPANILLENGVERVKITDFGLARAATEASLTQSGVVAGTPQYMSPEQAEGKAIDQRTDLFSLGSVLYAMCTGRAPFRASGTMAVLKRVCEDTPTPIRETNPAIPEWLVAIIAKLHAKNPADRFQSATEVAELLGRHLAQVQHPSFAPLSPGARGAEGEGAGVLSPTPFEDSGRATHRRRWAYAAAVLLCLLGTLTLTEATGVTNFHATVIRIFTPEGTLVVETDDPRVKVTIEGDGGLIITGAGLEEIRLRPGSYKVHADKDGKRVQLDRDLVTITRGDREVVKVRVEGGAPAGAGPAVPDRPAADGRHTATVRCVAYSPDGKLLASGGEDSLVIIRDADTMLERARLRHTSWVWSMAFSPDSGKLVTAQGDGRLKLWDVKTATELPTFRGHPGSFISVAFSPDGRYVLSGGHHDDKSVQLWNTKTGEEVRRFNGRHDAIVWGVAFSKDGHRALSGSGDGTVRLWDVETGELLARLEGHTGEVRSVAFSADGNLALSGSGGPRKDGRWVDCSVRVWDLKTRKEVQRYEGHGERVWSVVFLSDGRRALSAGGLIARLWDVQTGKNLRGFEGHSAILTSLTLSPDERRLATGSEDRTVRVWDLESGNELPLGVAAPEKSPFVVLGSDGGKGVGERKFDTLAEAVAAAEHGDVIEIRGDGPFETDGVEVRGRALTFRAAPGFRPVVSLSATGRDKNRSMFVGHSAPLTLEGLTLQRIGSSPTQAGALIYTETSPLRVANCRFVVKDNNAVALWGQLSPTMDVRNCAFVGSRDAVIFGPPPKEGTLSVDNCLLATWSGVGFNYADQLHRADIRLTRNTFAGGIAVPFGIGTVPDFVTSGTRPEAKRFRVEVENNIFAVTGCTFCALQYAEAWREKRLAAEKFKMLVSELVEWRDRHNLHSPTVPFMASQRPLPTGPGPFEPLVGADQLDAWRQFAGPDAGGLRGKAVFAGGDLWAQVIASPERLLPKDFRLRPDSAGYKAGKDGKDLGADVDLVGPGPAYERWKKTPEYQQWLKETGQGKK